MKTRASYDMTIKLENLDNQQEETYFLVRAPEENWPEKKISMYHPLGKAIFSKTVGDTIQVTLDKESKKYTIKNIEPT